jgi:hypothetical protein
MKLMSDKSWINGGIKQIQIGLFGSSPNVNSCAYNYTNLSNLRYMYGGVTRNLSRSMGSEPRYITPSDFKAMVLKAK